MLLGLPAAAGVVTIDFTGNGGLQAGNSMVFTQDGVTVTAIAGANALTDEYNISSRIGQYGNGLGNTTNFSYDYITNPGAIGCWLFGNCNYATANVTDGSYEVDDHYEAGGLFNGKGVREFITLDFNGLDVTLLGAEFGAHQLLDTASVTITGSGETIYAGYRSVLDADDFADHSGSMFDFIAMGPVLNNNDWTLKSITFSFENGGPDPSQVPVPASLALLGAGLAGLGLMRRRK